MKIAANLTFIFLLAALYGGMTGCTNNSEEELFGKQKPDNCDLSQVTYALTIKPMLQQHCYSCHSSDIASGNVVLDNYAGVKKQMDNGRLLGAVRHLPGYTPMPFNGSKLSDCNIARIVKWFDAGAPDN